MADATDPKVTLHSPRNAKDSYFAAVPVVVAGDPKYPSVHLGRRGSPRTKFLDTQIVEPVKSAVVSPAPETEQVWKKTLNGDGKVSPVMGEESWPTLQVESTKASPKSSSSDSLKAQSDDAAIPPLQIVQNSNSSSPSEVIPNNSANPSSVSNPVIRQSSMKRGGGSSSGSFNSGSSQLHSPQPQASVGVPSNTSGKPAVESSPRDHPHKSQAGNENQNQRHSYRKGSGRARGDGSYHQNYGGKQDHGRGNHDWNQQNRGFGNKDVYVQPQRGFPSRYISPSPYIAPVQVPYISGPYLPVSYISGPHMPVPGTLRPPFGNPMAYYDVQPNSFINYPGPPPPPPDTLRAMTMAAPLQSHELYTQQFYGPPGPDLQLNTKIVKQIDYYFSEENLIKDKYLKMNMDDQGWVSIKLIAGFNRVKELVGDIERIINALQSSTVVEVQGHNVRRRNDWMKWVVHQPDGFSNMSSPQAAGMLASSLQTVELDNKTSNQDHAENYSSSLQVSSTAGAEGTHQVSSSAETEDMGQVSSKAGVEGPANA